MDEKVLAQSDAYQITWYDQGSEVVFITFNTITGDFDSKPFGKDFLL